MEDWVGRVFGRLTVRKLADDQGGKPHADRRYFRWDCVCECGEEKLGVDGNHLRKGLVKSCGCFRREMGVKRGKDSAAAHGMTKTPTHSTWVAMIRRCDGRDKDGRKGYFERGISVCPRWLHSFELFFKDMGERPAGTTIDRIDNDGDYEPGNCRWATPSQQQRNKGSNRLITYNGMTKCTAEWEEITGINSTTILARLDMGWNVADALTKPIQPHKKASFPSIVIGGKKVKLKDAAKAAGIPYRKALARFEVGLSVEEILHVGKLNRWRNRHTR